MRPRNLLLLFLLVAALGAFIYFVERDLPSSEERAREADRLVSLDADEITALTLVHDGVEVRLERSPAGGDAGAAESGKGGEVAGKTRGSWNLVRPLAARADQEMVERLVGSLTGLRAERTIQDYRAPGYDAAGLGLEPPRVAVTFEAAGAETTLKVGAAIPASANVVMALAGRSEAFVVDGAVVPDLLRPAEEWRATDLFPRTRPEIRTVALSTAERTLVVERRGDSEDFWFEEPATGASDRLSEDRADEILGDLVALRAERFVDPPAPGAAELGLEPPSTTIEVSFAEGPDFHLELGAPVPGAAGRTYARIGDHLYEVSTRLPELARGPIDGWRSPAWSLLPVYLVDAVTLELDGTSLELHRDGSEWLRQGETIPYDAVSELLYAIHEARAEQILGPGQAPSLSAEPRLRLHLATSSGAEEDLSLEPFGDRLAARTGSREVLLVLPVATTDEVLRLATALRDAPAVPKPGSERADEPAPTP